MAGMRGLPFTQALAQAASHVENRLETLLAALDRGDAPQRLVAAMRHGVLGGGKRLRPFLVMASADLFDRDPAQSLQAAAAIEMLHCYSLVHDDLPAMDDDDVRRGQPSVHRAFDEASAVLAGDALLTHAFTALADPAADPDPAIRLRLIAILAEASGAAGMIGGQMLDLAAEGRFETQGRKTLSEAAIRQLQAMKTGALMRAAVMMGASIGRADPVKTKALEAYGAALGACFQVADDILDIEADADMLGKATAKDAAKGKATLVEHLGLDAARAERDRLADAAVAALSAFGPEADLLREAAQFTAKRAK
jgi:farnesyl diphosphate synthase